jgi:hypothetical protein
MEHRSETICFLQNELSNSTDDFNSLLATTEQQRDHHQPRASTEEASTSTVELNRDDHVAEMEVIKQLHAAELEQLKVKLNDQFALSSTLKQERDNLYQEMLKAELRWDHHQRLDAQYDREHCYSSHRVHHTFSLQQATTSTSDLGCDEREAEIDGIHQLHFKEKEQWEVELNDLSELASALEYDRDKLHEKLLNEGLPSHTQEVSTSTSDLACNADEASKNELDYQLVSENDQWKVKYYDECQKYRRVDAATR